MKKVGFWCAFLGILLIGCGNAVMEQGNLSIPIEDKNSTTPVIQEQSSQATAPTTSPTTLTSIDAYDGYIFITGGLITKGMRTNSLLLSTVPTPKITTYTGFMTFDLSAIGDIGSYSLAELRFFALQGTPKNANLPGGTISVLKPGDAKYASWGNYNCYSAASCHPLDDFQGNDLRSYGIHPQGNGWWHMHYLGDQEDLQQLLKQWPAKYITFVIREGYYNPNNVSTQFPLYVEDGGNHYRTGNRPTLVLTPPPPPPPPPPSGNDPKVLNTVDQYTGSMYGSGMAHVLALPGIIDSSTGGGHSWSGGFMTFDLSNLAQSAAVRKAQLDFYGIGVKSCWNNENPTIRMRYLTPDDSQYATWQRFSCFAPNPCDTHGFWTSEYASPEFEAVPIGNGWWQVKDSAEFRSIFQQDITNGTKYITFIPSTILCNGHDDLAFNMSRSLVIEDGANHGKTGEIPRLTFTY